MTATNPVLAPAQTEQFNQAQSALLSMFTKEEILETLDSLLYVHSYVDTEDVMDNKSAFKYRYLIAKMATMARLYYANENDKH